MPFKDDFNADLMDVFYDTDEFADQVIYEDAIGTKTPIPALKSFAEVKGVLSDIYQTPVVMDFSEDGKLIVDGIAYLIVSAETDDGETTFILGDEA